MAEELAVGGEEEGAVGFEGCDVDFVSLFLKVWGGEGGCCDDGADFAADRVEEVPVGVDDQEQPEEGRGRVDEHADQVADLEPGDVVGRSAVVDHGVVARFQDAQAVLVVPAVEVPVDGSVQLPAAREPFPGRVFGEQSQEYHREVLLVVPDPYLS